MNVFLMRKNLLKHKGAKTIYQSCVRAVDVGLMTPQVKLVILPASPYLLSKRGQHLFFCTF